jgi:hypothetical protein
MGALEQVTQMRREGRTDEEIISKLKEQRVSPKEINEALNHSQIKNAVSDIRGDDPPEPLPEDSQQYSDQSYGDYNQTTQEQQNVGYDQSQVYNPQPQEYYPQQSYQGYGDTYSQQTSTDTIIEVSEQVFEEKSSDIVKKIDSFEEFKSLTQTRLEDLNERVKRIEMLMDKLQAAILEKIGSYGSNLESIKKEMSMMQDSFSKTLSPMVEIAQNKNKISTKKSIK